MLQINVYRNSYTRFDELLGVGRHERRVVHPSSSQDPSGPHPIYLFIWLFFCILYNQLVNISKRFSEFCELL